MLHQALHQLLSGNPVGHIGGPWWFLHAWLWLYTTRASKLSILTNNLFPSDFVDDEDPTERPCASLGEIALSATNVNPSAHLLADWFHTFYYDHEDVAWFVHDIARQFDTPSRFPLDHPSIDDEASLLRIILSPRPLLVGVAPEWGQFLMYELYNPSIRMFLL
jgi:hypothetical protein